MTRDFAVGVVALAVGMGLGVLYFAGLRATVAHLARTGRPALVVVGSFLVRTGLLLGGLALLLRAGWPYVLCGMLGFWLSRELALRWWGAGPMEMRQR